MKTYLLPASEIVVIEITKEDDKNHIFLSGDRLSMSKVMFHALVQYWINEDILKEKVIAGMLTQKHTS